MKNSRQSVGLQTRATQLLSLKTGLLLGMACLSLVGHTSDTTQVQPPILTDSVTKQSHAVMEQRDPVNKLPETIQAKLAQANIPTDSMSMVVQPLTDNPQNAASTTPQTPLFSYNADVPRTPASTQKLIPTYVALDSLGKDFVWQTKLYQHGFVWKGTLYGDVIVQGSGDPKLENERLYQLLAMIKAQGIQQVQGNLIIDNRQFEGVDFDVNAFDGKGLRPYNAQPNALLTNFGTVEVDLVPIAKPNAIAAIKPAKASASGSSATTSNTSDLYNEAANLEQIQSKPSINPKDVAAYQVSLKPALANFTMPTTLQASQEPCNSNQDDWIGTLTSTGLSFHQTASAFCGEQKRYLTFPDGDVLVKQQIIANWQKILPNFTGNIEFANPAVPYMQQAKAIPQALPWYIRLYLKYFGKPLTPKLVGYVASNPLHEQIKDINQHSNNVMTEQIALSLPLYADKQRISTYPKTFAYIHQWWQQKLPQAQPPVMTRASGLCRDCRVAPNSMLALLTLAYHSPNFTVYRDSLGVAGESGTIKALKLRQPNNPAIGHAWIKTGTLDNVTSMAGYVQGKSGKWYAVVGMINADNVKNNSNAKAVLDEMLAWTALQ